EQVAVFATQPANTYSGTRIAVGESHKVYGSSVAVQEAGGRYQLSFTPVTVPAPGPTVKAYFESTDGTIWETEMRRLVLHVNCTLQPVIVGESIAAVWVDIY